MNPLAALLLPLSLVVAGTTAQAVEAGQAIHADRATSHVTAGPAARSGSGSGADAATTPGSDGSAASAYQPLQVGPEIPARTGHSPAGSVEDPSLRDRWAWPLDPPPRVVRPFLRPPSRYGAGHRGVDLSGTPGQQVLAVESGTVTHVGRIAGRGTVTVLHPSGIRSTYEPVAPAVTVGARVARGAALGRLEQNGSHCGTVACLHLGAIRGDEYLDPMVFLAGGGRVRLLPLAQVPDG